MSYGQRDEFVTQVEGAVGFGPFLVVMKLFCDLRRAPRGIPGSMARIQFVGKVDLPLFTAVKESLQPAALADVVGNGSDGRRQPRVQFGMADGVQQDAERNQSLFFMVDG